MENILVLTNPFEFSERIILYSHQISVRLGVDLEFIHIIDKDHVGWHPGLNRNLYYPGELTFSQFIDHETNRLSEEILRLIEKVTGSDDYELKVKAGNPLEILKKEVLNKKNTFLLICHTVGNPDIEPVNADAMTDEIKCPVWVIYPETKFLLPKSILFISHPNSFEKEFFIYTTGLTEKLNASLTVASDKVEESRIKELVKENKNNEVNVFSYLKLKELLNYTKDESFDLIVAIKENRSFLQGMAGDDKTTKLIRNSHKPILVFHED